MGPFKKLQKLIKITIFFRAGMLKLKIALDLSEYLINEDQYIPWSVGLGNLHYIGKLLEGKPEHEDYKVRGN